MSKAIVFGGSGFLGSHVVDVLTKRGHEVKIFDLKPSAYIKPNQKMIIGDILDAEKVRDAVNGCDYVYNFAGIADLDDASVKPLETAIQNIKGTVILLEAAQQNNIKRFIYASTIYVYSNRGGFYRCSKQAAEVYIEEFQRKYNLPFTILRYGTLYGERADSRNSVYRYVYQAIKEKTIKCTSTGEEMREYINVKDAAILSVDILDKKHENKHVIISGHYPIKFMQLLDTIKEICNNGIKIECSISKNSDHYNMTPYLFTPKIGYKLTSDCYSDMGQGLLEIFNEIYSRLEQDKIKTHD